MQPILKKKYKEVFFIKPNDFDNEFLDALFHKIVPFLKTMPWLILIPLVFVFSLIFVFIFKTKAIWFVSLLQYGF